MKNKCINLKRERIRFRVTTHLYDRLPYWFWGPAFMDARVNIFYSYMDDDKKIIKFFLNKFKYTKKREQVKLLSMKEKFKNSKEYEVVFSEDYNSTIITHKSNFELELV